MSVEYVWRSDYNGIRLAAQAHPRLHGARARALGLLARDNARRIRRRQVGRGPVRRQLGCAYEPRRPLAGSAAAGECTRPVALEPCRRDDRRASRHAPHRAGAARPVRLRLGPGGAVPAGRSRSSLPPGDAGSRVHGLGLHAAAEAASARALALPTTRPRSLRRRYLGVGQSSAVPAFGTPEHAAWARDYFANDSDGGALSAAVYETQRIAGNAKNPYAAAVAIEAWLRSSGGFTYDETPPRVQGPPLVQFVTKTKRGYCQHFAGAMALMLRYLGIPARVAAGFTSGSYDEEAGTWSVNDRDAHTWVEVWFTGYGWLPFDPTPGRGNAGRPLHDLLRLVRRGRGREGAGRKCPRRCAVSFVSSSAPWARRPAASRAEPAQRRDRSGAGGSARKGRGGGCVDRRPRRSHRCPLPGGRQAGAPPEPVPDEGPAGAGGRVPAGGRGLPEGPADRRAAQHRAP